MEAELIRWLSERVPRAAPVRLGIGDDAAVVEAAGGPLVLTSDMLVEGVHFARDQFDFRRVGRKSLAVNLSDMAAMAARPTLAVVSLAIRRGLRLDDIQELYEGLLALAERFGVAVVGGDTNLWDQGLVINVTLLGEPTRRGALTRRGAQPGDRLLVTGTLGGSLLGKHETFEPRVAESLKLHARYAIRAAMDISDGLSLDLSRMLEASGCGAVLHAESIPVADAARQRAQNSGASPLAHALGDGEDFELLLAMAPAEAERVLREQPLDVPVTRIGECVKQPGLWLERAGRREPLEPRGFLHG